MAKTKKAPKKKYTKAQQAQLDRPAKVLKTAHIPGPRRRPKVVEIVRVQAAEDVTEAKPVVTDEAKPVKRKKGELESPMKFGEIG